MGLGMGGHQLPNEGKTNVWFTPKYIIDAIGDIDLDPCSRSDRPFPIAKTHYNEGEQDGLALPWDGFVFLNPPYGKKVGDWLNKLRVHDNGIALVFARTETSWFFDEVWPHASALFFIKGRLKFVPSVEGMDITNSGAPSVLIAYGDEAYERLENINLPGQLILM